MSDTLDSSALPLARSLAEARNSAIESLRRDLRRTLRPDDFLDDPHPPPPAPPTTTGQALGKGDERSRTIDSATRHPGLFDAMTAAYDAGPGAFERVRDRAAVPRRPGDQPAAPAGAHGSRGYWDKVFADHEKTFDDLEPWRIRVAWRWVREVSRLTGRCDEDDSLADVLTSSDGGVDDVDPWTEPCNGLQNVPAPNSPEGKHYRAAYSAVRDILPIAEAVPNGPALRRGVSLLPPPVPAAWRAHPDEYDPENPQADPELHHWLRTFNRVKAMLGLDTGTEKEPDAGRWGCAGLTNPVTCRLVFPHPAAIVAFEEAIVHEAAQAVVKEGIAGGTKRMMRRYGLTAREAQSVVACAKKDMRNRLTRNIDDDRAIMVERLEGFMRRARHALNLREEMAAMKQLAIIQGLSKGEPENEMRDIIDVIRETAEKRIASAAEPKALDYTVSDAEPDEDAA